MKTQKIIITAIVSIQFFALTNTECFGQQWLKNFFALFAKEAPVTKIYGERDIEKGDTAVIRWHIEDAKRIDIEGVAENINNEDSIKVYPDSTAFYKFIIHRKKEVTRRYFKVSVYEPEIRYFRVPDAATDEEEVKISWSVNNAQHVYIPGIADSLNTYGSINTKLHDTVLTLIAEGAFSTVTKKAYINLHVIENFGATNIERAGAAHTERSGAANTEDYGGISIIYRGRQATIWWKLKNTDSVRVTGINKSLLTKDTLIVSPVKTTNYDLLIYRSNGNTDTIPHTVEVISPVIQRFYAPDEVKAKQNIPVTWQCAGVDKAWLGAEEVPPYGRSTINIKNDTSLTLTIYDGDIPIRKKISVGLIPKRKYVVNIDTNKRNYTRGLDCDIISVDRSEYPKKVKMQVLVVDTFGNYVSNIAPPYSTTRNAKKYFKFLNEEINGKYYPKDFTIREMRIDTGKWYDISMVMDHSGSMYSEIDELQDAAKEFINNKYSSDRVSVVKFDHFIQKMNGLNIDSKSILHSANFKGLANFGGCTALYAGMDEGVISLSNARKNKMLIVFTDGYENSSFYYFGKRAFNPGEIAAKVRAMDIKLFIVSYGSAVNHKLLDKLASLSGGKHYNLWNLNEIKKVFRELPRVFRYHYEITFRPHEAKGEHRYMLSFSNNNGGLIKREQTMYIGDDYDIGTRSFNIPVYMRTDMPVDIDVITNPQVIARFGFNKYNLKLQYSPIIDKYIEYMKLNKDAHVLLAGHTDSKGSNAYCNALSMKRAAEVRDYLESNGISSHRIKVKGYGKNIPIWQLDNTEQKAFENRRVEAVLYEPKKQNTAQK